MACRMIVGCGYVGMEVAKRWLVRGDRVIGVTRSEARATDLRHSGIVPLVWNWITPPSEPVLQAWKEISEVEPVESLLVSVSHAPVEGVPSAESHTRGLEQLLRLLPFTDTKTKIGSGIRCRWVYLSTTGVLSGVSDGDWVNEQSPISPQRPGPVAAAAAEEWIATHLPKGTFTVLRPAGIYGPGRFPNWQAIRDQTPLAVDPESYLNLIHVHDLADTIVYFFDHPSLHSLYCVSDNQPPKRSEYYQTIAELGGFPIPVFATSFPDRDRSSEDSHAKRPRSSDNKRISADRLLTELPFRFRHESFQSGLREGWPLVLKAQAKGD